MAGVPPSLTAPTLSTDVFPHLAIFGRCILPNKDPVDGKWLNCAADARVLDLDAVQPISSYARFLQLLSSRKEDCFSDDDLHYQKQLGAYFCIQCSLHGPSTPAIQ
jgi:hypothetical protein